MSATLDHAAVLTALQQGEIQLQGQFVHGSNYTFLGTLQYEENSFQVVYKPTRGEQPLWDFPTGSLSRREVAAYTVSQSLGWNLVPPTIYRRRGPLGPGSLQQFIDHDPQIHFFTFSQEDRQRLRPVVLFDILINNADRKGGHILKDDQNHIWLIDHGICFHVDDKLRTVVWDFAGQPIPGDHLQEMRAFLEKLESADAGLTEQLRKLLMPSEIRAIAARTRSLLEQGIFPLPAENRCQYPWPPV